MSLRRGMSILEVAIAAGILAAASVPFIHSLLASRAGLTASMDEIAATMEATHTMELLKRMVWEEIPVTQDREAVPDSEWNGGKFAWPPEAPPPAGLSVAAALARLGPPAKGMQRFLNVTMVPAGSKDDERPVYLKLVDVRVVWKRAAEGEDNLRSIALCTLLGPK